MAIKVKICGIKTKSAALTSAKYGADFLGFNFVPASKRHISLAQAKNIISALPKNNRPKIVGVFQNQPLGFVQKAAKVLNLDFVQLHGEESPVYCAKIKLPIIKAFGLSSDFNIKKTLAEMAKYKVKFYMLDRKNRGEGKLLNFKKVKQLAKKFPVMLAGGLTPENVAFAIKSSTNIVAVDVAGGVETNGNKDLIKVMNFINKSKA